MNPIVAIEYVWLAAAAVLAAGVWSQWRTSAGRPARVRRGLVALRAATALALALLALNLGRWRQPRHAAEREWVLCLDRSASMATADVGGRPRWTAAVDLVRRALERAPVRDRLRIVAFDTRLGAPLPAAALANARPDGAGTDLNAALNELLDRHPADSRKLAGVVVFSDGRQTARRAAFDAAHRALARGVALAAVELGGPVARRDLDLSLRRRHLVAHRGQRLKIRAQVANRNLGDIRTPVRLLAPDGALLAEQAVELPNNASVDAVFEVAPTNAGTAVYRVTVPAWDGETRQANNTAEARVVVTEHPVRVLLAEGTPGWDSKFLAQLLRRQTNLVVQAVYRISEDRWFRIDADGAQPGTAADAVFPADAAALAAYDVIVLGKGVEYVLDAARVNLLKTFLREQGGTVVLSRGKPYSGGTFPVFDALAPVEWGAPTGGEFRWRPTVEGAEAGLFGAMLPAVDDPVWARLPLLRGAVQCPRIKSFATVLVDGVGGPGAGIAAGVPMVVSMRYGKGLTIAVNGEGLWQWDFFADKESQAVYTEFWTQLLQWAVTYADFLPGYSYAVRVPASLTPPGEPVPVRLSHRGPEKPAENLAVRVRRPDGTTQALTPARVAARGDRWEAAFTPEAAGVYQVELTDGADGRLLAPAESVEVPPLPAEGDDVSADPDYLRRFSAQAGGATLTPAEWAAYSAALRTDEPAELRGAAVWEPAWDRAWVLCVVVGLLSVEWYVRRRNGLA